MSTYIRPDNGEFIVLGDVTAESLSSSSATSLSELVVDSTSDIDLNNIPNWTELTDNTDPGYAPTAAAIKGGAWVGGNLYVDGTFVANGDVVTLGNASGSVTFNTNISSDIVPSQTQTYNVGSSTSIWNKVYTRQIIAPQFIDCITSASVDYMTDMIQTTTNAAISLPDAEEGFVKMFITISTPSSPVTVTPDSPLGFNTITFTNAGDSATLIYNSSGWHVVSVFRATVV